MRSSCATEQDPSTPHGAVTTAASITEDNDADRPKPSRPRFRSMQARIWGPFGTHTLCPVVNDVCVCARLVRLHRGRPLTFSRVSTMSRDGRQLCPEMTHCQPHHCQPDQRQPDQEDGLLPANTRPREDRAPLRLRTSLRPSTSTRTPTRSIPQTITARAVFHAFMAARAVSVDVHGLVGVCALPPHRVSGMSGSDKAKRWRRVPVAVPNTRGAARGVRLKFAVDDEHVGRSTVVAKHTATVVAVRCVGSTRSIGPVRRCSGGTSC